MGSKIFAALSAEEIEMASDIAQKFTSGLVGHNVGVIAAANVMVCEFISRHTHFSVDDIIEATALLSAINTKTGNVGSMTTSKVSKGN